MSMDFVNELRAARAGQRDATERILARFLPQVRQMVHKAVADDLGQRRPRLASMFSTGDIVQEVCVAVIRDLDDLRVVDERCFAAYLSTLVKNRLVDMIRFHEAACRDHRRVGDLVGEGGAQIIAAEQTGPVTAAQVAETREAAIRALAALPERDSAILRGRIADDKSFPQLAEELGFRTDDAARKAFYSAQSRLLLKLRAMDVRPEAGRG